VVIFGSIDPIAPVIARRDDGQPVNRAVASSGSLNYAFLIDKCLRVVAIESRCLDRVCEADEAVGRIAPNAMERDESKPRSTTATGGDATAKSGQCA
jgi:hypothetical protein